MRKIARKLLKKSLKPERQSKELRAGVNGLRTTEALQLKRSQKKAGVKKTKKKRASEIKEKIEKGRRMARERSRRYRLKQKEQKEQTGAEAAPIEVSEGSTPFANRMAKKCAVERAKKNLPATPEKKAEVVAAVTQSPRTRKVQEKRGLVKTPEEEKEVAALKALASDLAEGIKAIKNVSTDGTRSSEITFFWQERKKN